MTNNHTLSIDNKHVPIEPKLKRNSLLVALLLCVNSFSIVVTVNGIVVLGTIACFLILLASNFDAIMNKRYMPSFIIVIITVVAFLLNIIIFKEPIITDYFLGFLCFGLPMLFLPMDHIDYKKVIYYVVLMGLCFLPFYIVTISRLNMLDIVYYDSEDILNTMTISYRVLPFVGACLLSLFESGRKERWLPLIVGIPYTVILFVVGSRGALVSLFLLFLLYFINGNGDVSCGVRRKVIAIGTTVFVVLFFDVIIDWIYTICQQHDINILAINRLQDKLSGTGGDLDSGRSELLRQSISQIKSSPIIGNGIASSLNYKSYPHNLLVQIFEEGGLVVFLPFMVLFLKGVFAMLLSLYRTGYFLMLIYVFCSGVVQLMFSANYWTSQYFWAFVFLVIYKREIIRIHYCPKKFFHKVS